MRLVILLIAMLAGLVALPASAERIKDLGTFQGLRTNQLTGYGIVVGLAGTGDDNLDYTTQGMRSVASRFGLTLPAGQTQPSLKNAAAVMITAELPAFAKPGQKLDITVAALGKAKSLRGGTLLMTPMQGADGQIYAMAQGNLAVGGLGVTAADGSNVTVNVPSAGRIPGGATVEKAVDAGFATTPEIKFNLAEADLTTVERVADAINARIGTGRARAIDAVTVAINAPQGAEVRTALMGQIEDLLVEPADAPARVIVNARTGTVVINGAVRIAPAAVSHGKLTVKVNETLKVSQPGPFSNGQTAIVPKSSISIDEEKHPMFRFAPGASLADIVKAVNAIGASPADLVAILEALKEAGAMKADLVVL
ncbi:flagellar basal body P-ring protein FlgI [Sphingomonas nostoxanthinifaciens]|uniref:flagellar basal body P-ring protein FlgI n=1 Tax=Sphingomonas nostoxanthinifaciens TaxID=2872652 RepID=UPI001CC1EF4A|nr:flagellar basal body P-ring protein FlgI [Sphingomonas nostoxanthinifaciens]UAK26062.1 flagellar basal body P-ring protein FlgI [Sphingomonas nostoxanthinifaciens]